MGKLLRIVMPLGLILASAALVAVLVNHEKNKRPERKDAPEQALLVDAIAAHVGSTNLTVTSQGTVQPRTETVLVAEVSGKIVSVSPSFNAGGFFRSDEILLQIDPSDYQTAVKRAQAGLASRQAQYADQKARSDQALKDWENLGRQGKPSDLALRKPQLAEATAAVLAAEADLLQAERNLIRTRITVPYDGLVRSKQVDVGQYVTPGTPVGITFAIDSAEIRLPLTSSDISYLQLPSATDLAESNRPKVRLTDDTDGSSKEWQAEIIRTEGVVDEVSRVVYAVARVVDPYGILGGSTQPELKIGSFVRAEVQGLRVDNIVELPRAVLRSNDTVLIANEQRLLEVRKVKLLRTEPDKVYITAGIEEGELVISTAMQAPIPGTRLVISTHPDGPGRKGATLSASQ